MSSDQIERSVNARTAADELSADTARTPHAPSTGGTVIDLRDGTGPGRSDVVRTSRTPDDGRDTFARRAFGGRLAGFVTTPTVLLAADVVAWAVTAPLASGGAIAESLLLVTVLAVVAGTKGYRARLTLSGLDQMPRVLLAVGAGTLVQLVYSLSTVPEAGPGQALLRGGLLLLALAVARAAAIALIRASRRSGIVGHRTLVIGAGEVGHDLVARLQERRDLGLRPVGILDRAPSTTTSSSVPWLGDVDQMARVVQEEDVQVVVVAFTRTREADLVDVVRTCDRLECDFFVVPRLYEVQSVDGDMDEADGLPLLRVRRAAFRTRAWQLKRLLDVVLSSLMLVVAAPVMAVTALAVRREGGPGVLFKQQRIGLDGRPFTILKFRSMRPVDSTESQTQWNISNDDRVGPVGRVIRATSLDELPQLFNVLRGDMSIVGPRPERPHFVEEFTDAIPRYTGRHRVPAGLTGLAAVSGLRGDTSIAERARIDNYYIENWSLWLDLKVLLRTVGAVLGRTGS